jgi:hypothetical protein
VNLPEGYEVVQGAEPGERTLIEHAPSYSPANKAYIPVKHADYRAVAGFRPKVQVETIEEAARLDAKSRNARWSADDREDARGRSTTCLPEVRVGGVERQGWPQWRTA